MTSNRHHAFYSRVLPLLTLANIFLAVVMLLDLRPRWWQGWLELTAAVFCSAVAGWLAGTGWSRSFWSQVISTQVGRWLILMDVVCSWLGETQVPAESVRRLQVSLAAALESREDLGWQRGGTRPGGIAVDGRPTAT